MATKRRSPAHLITRAEMARRLELSRPSVTKACRAGGRLAPACKGLAVNVLHPAARRWLAERRAATRAATVELPPPEAPIPVDEVDDSELDDERPSAAELERELGAGQRIDLDELAIILTDLTDRFGEAHAVLPWVRCRKTLEEARKAGMLRERVAGRLIARTTVVRMVDHVDTAFRLMLSDAPRTIATRLSAPDMPAAIAMIRDAMGQFLESARDHMIAALEADDPMMPLAEAAE